MIFRILILSFVLSACGKTDEPRTYEINGEQKVCTILEEKPCGLTLACENAGIYECVSN